MTYPRIALLRPAAWVGLALALGACGSGGRHGPGADPATAVPAGAALYAELVVRPEGRARSDLDDAGRKLLATNDPEGRVRALLDGAHPWGLSYERDVRPWLGPRIGLFLAPTTDGGPAPAAPGAHPARARWAVVVDITDRGAARAALHRVLSARPGSRPEARTHAGVSYEVDPGHDTAAGIVGPFAVIGTESALVAVIDTRLGPSLARSAPYQRVRSGLTVRGGVTTYLNTSALSGLVAGSGPGARLRALLAAGGARTVAVTAGADGHAIHVEAVMLGAPAGTPSASAIVAGLPADSWLALGGAGVGPRLRQLLGGLARTPTPPATPTGSAGRLTRALTAALGATGPLLRDLAGWAGDVSAFARGTSLLDLNGALVISSRDPAHTRTWVGRLRAQLARSRSVRVAPLTAPGVDTGFVARSTVLPIGLDIAAAGPRLVIALGAGGLTEALAPTSALRSSSSYASAVAALGAGMRPSLYLDPRPLLGFLDALSAGRAAGPYARLRSYTQQLGPIQAGSERVGDLTRTRLVISLL